jgi:hypothetical protein
VACVEEACKEPVQKIMENAGMRKAEERMKERETAVEVKNSKENLCMWNNNIMRWNQEGGVVESESKRELWMGEKEEENLRHRRRS